MRTFLGMDCRDPGYTQTWGNLSGVTYVADRYWLTVDHYLDKKCLHIHITEIVMYFQLTLRKRSI